MVAYQNTDKIRAKQTKVSWLNNLRLSVLSHSLNSLITNLFSRGVIPPDGWTVAQGSSCHTNRRQITAAAHRMAGYQGRDKAREDNKKKKKYQRLTDLIFTRYINQGEKTTSEMPLQILATEPEHSKGRISLPTANTRSDTRGKKWRGRRQSRVAERSAGSKGIGWHSARSITCRRVAVCKEKLLLPLQHGKVATGLPL